MRQQSLYLDNTRLTERLFVCQNFFERSRGLLWRKPIEAAAGEALLIPRCNSVHTAFMAYPIDVIFVDRKGKITSIRRGLAPWRAALDMRAGLTIECAEHTAWTRDLQPGQILRWN